MITFIHFNLLSILIQSYPFRPDSTDEYIERHTKNIQLGSSRKYYEKFTELSHTTEKTDEQIALNRKQTGEIISFIYKHRLQRDHLCFVLHKCNHTP